MNRIKLILGASILLLVSGQVNAQPVITGMKRVSLMIRRIVLFAALALSPTQVPASSVFYTFEGDFSRASDPDGLISDEIEVASQSPFEFHWILDLDNRGTSLRNDGAYSTHIEYFGNDYKRETFFATLDEGSLFLDVIDGGRFDEPYNVVDYRVATSWTDIDLLDGFDPSQTFFTAGSQDHEFNISCEQSISALVIGSECIGIEITNAPLVGNHNPIAKIYSNLTLTAFGEYPAILLVSIDIKPGSDPNCFNINGHGVIPVAILGSDSFDVTEIVQDNLSFGGLEVRVRGNKGPLCQVDYSDGDEYLDLVCQFEDNSDYWSPGEGEATLTGSLINGGGDFEGTDSICVVP